MIKLLDILKEAIGFSNWVMPSLSNLKQEFKIEQEMKGNEFWEDEEDFLNAVKNGKIVTINSSEDQNIDYRSGTTSYEELLDLIQGYRSYPEFRNEKTLKDIYDGFKENKAMDYPIVIEDENGSRRVFSGNTRMDIAFQLGIDPKVLLIRGEL
jgi:thiol-disulfide isomerase/thioredoxin